MMEDFVNTIDLLGDEATANAIIERTITEYNDDVVTKLGNYSFASCTQLKSVNLPNVEVGENNEFVGCSKLETALLPRVTGQLTNTFVSCSKLKNVNINNVTMLYSAFNMCSALTTLDAPKLTRISSSSFQNCSSLTTLILRSETLCTLGSGNAFNNTPFASNGTGGTVYVPSALITEYQNATNWSTLYAGGKCNFVAIEGSEYE
jgi:hypothetical protein